MYNDLYNNITSEEVNMDNAIAEDNIINCYESETFRKFQYTINDILLTASAASTVFNIIILLCGFKLFKRSGNTMHLFIFNMTLGNLILTVFCHPHEFLIRKYAFLMHIHLCEVTHFYNWLGMAVSGLSLTLLNVDKLIYFRWPLIYDKIISKQRAVSLCIIVWVVSFGFVSYGWAFNIVYVTEDCILLMTAQNEYFYVIFMILFCILPVTSSLFISIYLFRLTFQKRIVPSTSSQVDMTIFRNKIKSLVFIFATTIWTSFSLLPYRIFNLCRIGLFDWNTMGCEQRHLMNWLAWILLYLLIVNPIINPFITAIIYTPYRISIRRMMINILNCNRYRYQKEIIDTSSLSMSRTLSRSSSSSFDHEMASLCPVNEVTSSPNFNDGACTTPSTEETNGNIGKSDVETASFLLNPKFPIQF